jgi:hypothetical protein
MRSVVLCAAVLIGGVPGCCASPPAGAKHEARPADVPPEWAAAADKAKVGDVTVEALWVRVRAYGGPAPGGPAGREGTFVKLRLWNPRGSGAVTFAGWQGAARLQDERGNDYPPIPPGPDFQLPAGFAGSREEESGCITSRAFPSGDTVYPGGGLIAYILHEPMPDGAAEARITLDARALGGEGTVRLRKRR